MKILKSLLILTILSFCFSSVPASQSEPDHTKTPVFFVHGHGMGAESWKRMISFLVKAGYPPQFLHAIQLNPNIGPNIEASENQIAPAIEEFLESLNAYIMNRSSDSPLKTKIDLISHSMGALSARWYAGRIRPDRVRLWISLAGANHGTNVLCKHSDPGADDLCPAYAENPKQSLIQFLLNGKPGVPDVDETPYGIGVDSPGVASIASDSARNIIYLTIRTSPDRWIKPETSPILDGAGGGKILIPGHIRVDETSPGNFLMTNAVGHDEILGCSHTMQLVRTILNQVDHHR